MTKFTKEFKDALENLPLKPTLKQMQAAVDEHQKRIEEICEEVKKSNGKEKNHIR